MTRSFQFTTAADTAYHNLYAAILLVTGAVPTDGILPDRVQELTIQLDSPVNSAVNGGQTLIVGDRNGQGGIGIEAGGGNTWRSNRNSICLKDFQYKGTAGSLVVNLTLSSI